MLNYTPCRARRLRLRYRIPLSELAQAAGVSIQLINKIELERERQTPAHEKLLRNAFTLIIECRRTQLDAAAHSWMPWNGNWHSAAACFKP